MTSRSLLSRFAYLKPYAAHIRKRRERLKTLERELCPDGLLTFARGHHFFGLHRESSAWVFREWAPFAEAVYIKGPFSRWADLAEFALTRLDDHGSWEIRLPLSALKHGDPYNLTVRWPGGVGTRLPSYARYVCQEPNSLVFNARVWDPGEPYSWRHPHFKASHDAPLIYEAHVGMAQEKQGIGSYLEFRDKVLPRIVNAGYNTIQLMAIPEHPYYGSFGYHVTNFFAPSSRFGTPDELKALIDAAHGEGLTVIMDLVHSHAAKNEVEGLSRFDGSYYQYFHDGGRGYHEAWDSRCFDYSKHAVLHFLLSNCLYWLDEFHFDGFRFDGVTSMLYLHHGLGHDFAGLDEYYGPQVDEDAVLYLSLANKLIHQFNPHAITAAEDVSGMPGLAYPVANDGIGFDYRLAMGIPDYWIELIKDRRDENWHMGDLWYRLTNHREEEKVVVYAESHDQALVGDQTLAFRLIGPDMYRYMNVFESNPGVDRGMALHKMIRLVTLTAGGDAYLNFMGNEFGHPEWIDFPREGNGWSHQFARRQWGLCDDTNLRYRFLAVFDREMLALVKRVNLLGKKRGLWLQEHNDDHLLVFARGDLVFAFNFDPLKSQTGYPIFLPPGDYQLALDTDAPEYGGFGRLQKGLTFTARKPQPKSNKHAVTVYLPARTAMVLERLPN